MFSKLAFQNLWRNKRRTLLTELAIIFGIAVVVFTGAFLRGMYRFWAQDVFINAMTGAFQIEHRDYREKSTLDPLGTTLQNASQVIATVERVPGVDAAYGELRIIGIVSNGTRSDIFDGRGVDREGQRRVLGGADALIRSGRPLGSDPNEIVIGQLLAEKLGLEVGDPIMIVVKTQQGGVDMMIGKIVGIKSGSHFPSGTYLEMNLGRAQKFLRMPDRVSQILVKTHDFDRAQANARAARSVLTRAGYPVVVRDYAELIPMYLTVGGIFKLIAATISLILFVIIGLGIANAMFMAVRERRREIGTLMAIGMEPYQTRRLFLLEGVMTSVLGAIAGLALAIALTWLVGAHGGLRFSGPDGERIAVFPMIDWVIATLAFVLSIVISVAGSWFPASASAKLNPIEALTEA